jgi:hypothetical protein
MRQMANAMAGNSALRARFTGVMSAGVSPARAPEARRHLILAYRPGWQSVEDLNEIAGHVRDIDPTIRTFIVPNTSPNAVTRRQAAERPTLVYSAGIIPTFRPLRGKVYQGNPMPKAAEVSLMASRGVPVPRTALLTPDLMLDPAEWGEFVVVKPTDMSTSSQGHGFTLMRTHRVRYRLPHEYPEGHPGRRGPMLVQQYVHDRGHVAMSRVLTLFGEPLYLRKHRTRRPVVDLTATDEVLESTPIAHQSYDEDPETDHFFAAPEDELALARSVYQAIPEIPQQGIDIIRDGDTNKLYVLEINSRGNTWHFSSSFLAHRRVKEGAQRQRDLRNQFDAFRTAARAFVAKTNAEAV